MRPPNGDGDDGQARDPRRDGGVPIADLVARARLDAEQLAAPSQAFGAPPTAHVDAPSGYEITRPVSRGGQGIVYEGRHRSTGRRVALKLLRDDRAGPDERARFRREIALLVRIDAPGIVPVRDSVECDGRVWHIMDFIDGVPLDEWVRLRSPNLTATLGLVAAVADAVAAAHACGVVHRDLKPTNILVDDAGRPHVLDFGLAKLVEPGADHSELTVSGQFVGSVAWASPEQAEGASREVDTRSDVHALGLVAYSAISGRMPYPVDGSLRQTLEHIVHTEPAPLRHVDADTELIVLTCLRKDPARRYQSAAELAADLRRRIAGAPIAARGDSALYLAGKLLHRYRWPVAATAAVVALLAAAFVAALVQYVGKRREALNAREVSEFFVKELITSADPMRGSGRDARVIDVVDEAAQSLEGRFSDPLVDAYLRRTLGAAYRELSEPEKAEPLLERAVATLDAEASADDPQRLEAMAALARLRFDQGRPTESAHLLRSALAHADPTGETGLRLREDLCIVLEALGSVDEAEAGLVEILEARRAASPRDDAAVLNTIENVAGVLLNSGRAAEAEPLYREALEGFMALRGEGHPRAAVALVNLAACLVALGRVDDARPHAERALEIRRERLGPAHMRTLEALEVLAELEHRAGRNGEVVRLLADMVDGLAARGQSDSPEVLALRRRLAVARLAEGDAERSVAELRAILERQRGVVGPDSAESIETQRLLAKALRAERRYGEAETLLRDAIGRLERLPGEGPAGATTILATVGLGLTMAERGEATEGLAVIGEAAQRATSARGLRDPLTLFVVDAAWQVAVDAGDDARADGYARTAIEAIEQGAPVTTATRGEWLVRRAAALMRLGQGADAERLLDDAVESEPALADEASRVRSSRR